MIFWCYSGSKIPEFLIFRIFFDVASGMCSNFGIFSPPLLWRRLKTSVKISILQAHIEFISVWYHVYRWYMRFSAPYFWAFFVEKNNTWSRCFRHFCALQNCVPAPPHTPPEIRASKLMFDFRLTISGGVRGGRWVKNPHCICEFVHVLDLKPA